MIEDSNYKTGEVKEKQMSGNLPKSKREVPYSVLFWLAVVFLC